MSTRGAAQAVDQQVKEMVAQAEKEIDAGNYRRVVELLQPVCGAWREEADAAAGGGSCGVAVCVLPFLVRLQSRCRTHSGGWS